MYRKKDMPADSKYQSGYDLIAYELQKVYFDLLVYNNEEKV